MAERDQLSDLLAAHETFAPTEPPDATLVEFKAELDSLEQLVRQPHPSDPFVSEPACRRVVERIAELGREQSVGSRPESERQAAHADLGSVEQYRLIEKLGEGGMGAVYKAMHTRLERIVAIKILPPERLQDPQAIARFQREMRAVGKLQHPNIVAAHDAGEIDGTHYLVMELVEGTDLGKLASQQGPVPVNAACELIRQAALGCNMPTSTTSSIATSSPRT